MSITRTRALPGLYQRDGEKGGNGVVTVQLVFTRICISHHSLLTWVTSVLRESPLYAQK